MKKNILVLDDSPFMLNMISDLLRDLNYEVTAVDNGADACQKIKSSLYDLIITDMNMPGMDGFEFARQVRTYPGCRFLPIVMISSEKNDEKISKAKKMGVSTFLSKPIKINQLKTILQITLNKRMTPRLPLRLEVFYVKEKLSSEYKASYTFNVSLGGLFIETDDPLSPGERLELKLNLSENDRPIVCKGRVTWVNSPLSPCNNDHPPGMGLEFLGLEEVHRMQKFLKSETWRC